VAALERANHHKLEGGVRRGGKDVDGGYQKQGRRQGNYCRDVSVGRSSKQKYRAATLAGLQKEETRKNADGERGGIDRGTIELLL